MSLPSPIRLDEEFHQRLERERQEREATEVGALRRAVVLKRMTGEQELTRAAAETAMMATEDARSTHLVRFLQPAAFLMANELHDAHSSIGDVLMPCLSPTPCTLECLFSCCGDTHGPIRSSRLLRHRGYATPIAPQYGLNGIKPPLIVWGTPSTNQLNISFTCVVASASGRWATMFLLST